MRNFRLLLLTLGMTVLLVLSASAQPVSPISVLAPGENSIAISPIEVRALIYPGEDGLIRLTLTDCNHNLLARQLVRADVLDEDALAFTSLLFFEIPVESTPAFLTIATQDEKHRPLSLRSARVVLAESGKAVIEPVESEQTWLSITEPQPGTVINVSPLQIVGTVIPVNNNPVIIELLAENGKPVFSKQLVVEGQGSPMNFDVHLAYPPVSSANEMRLIVRQSSGCLGVDTILDSLPVTITP